MDYQVPLTEDQLDMVSEIHKITISTDFLQFHYEFYVENCYKFSHNQNQKLQLKIYNEFKSKIEYRIFDKIMETKTYT